MITRRLAVLLKQGQLGGKPSGAIAHDLQGGLTMFRSEDELALRREKAQEIREALERAQVGFEETR
jgi:hypothetical protein